MAAADTVVYEVRVAEAGVASDDYGGGFNPQRTGATKTATDNYTYGASFTVITLTDLTIYSSTANAIHSNTRDFVTADLGHIIHITAGTDWTVGWYEITAVTGTGATNRATVTGAANVTTSTSPGGNGTGTIGGALATPWSIWASTSCVSGNTIYIKKGDYTLESDVTISPAALLIYGYETTRGDEGRPTLIKGGTATRIVYRGDGTYWWVHNIEFTDSAETPSGYLCYTGNNQYTYFYNCKFYSCDGAIYSASSALYRCEFRDIEASNYVVSTIYSASGCTFINVGSKRGTLGYTAGFAKPAGYISNCIFALKQSISYPIISSNTGSYALFISNCIFYGTTGYNTGNGLYTYANWNNSNRMLYVVSNCIFCNLSGYGIITSAGAFRGAEIKNNAFYGCSSGNILYSGLLDYVEEGTVELSGVPFVDPDNGDFRLNNVAGAGAACRAAGIGPVGQTSYPDIGAVQHGDTTVPAVGDVKYGVMFGDDDALMGTFELPDLAQKRRIRSID